MRIQAAISCSSRQLCQKLSKSDIYRDISAFRRDLSQFEIYARDGAESPSLDGRSSESERSVHILRFIRFIDYFRQFGIDARRAFRPDEG